MNAPDNGQIAQCRNCGTPENGSIHYHEDCLKSLDAKLVLSGGIWRCTVLGCQLTVPNEPTPDSIPSKFSPRIQVLSHILTAHLATEYAPCRVPGCGQWYLNHTKRLMHEYKEHDGYVHHGAAFDKTLYEHSQVGALALPERPKPAKTREEKETLKLIEEEKGWIDLQMEIERVLASEPVEDDAIEVDD